MPTSAFLDGYVRPLLNGQRVECREYVREQAGQVPDPTHLYTKLLWPAMERVDKLHRADRIDTATQAMATRINRSIADQLQLHLRQADRNGKRMILMSAEGEPEELGAQMTADLFEARGWEVYFLGSAVPEDEILSLVGSLRPAILLIFGTQPSGVPAVRRLVDQIHEVGANPTMNIMVAGGVFNRADGLWKEVNADLVAKTAAEAIPLAEQAEPRCPEPRKPGAPKKRRRRRRPPLLAAAAAG